MPQNRVKFSNIVQNQLPAYVQDEFPLVAEFLKTYYEGQEYQSGPVDLGENIDKYIIDIIESIETSTQNYRWYTKGYIKYYKSRINSIIFWN